MFNYVYKILTQDEWSAFESTETLKGAPIDIEDGYIHLSTAKQAQETVNLHFGGENKIILLEIRACEMKPSLHYEASRGGLLFPHYYGVLELGWVNRSWTLDRNSFGVIELPQLDMSEIT